MKNILLIGIGGTGRSAIEMLNRKIEQLGNRTDNKIKFLLFNMDTGKVEDTEGVCSISMTDGAKVGRVCDRLGVDSLREWFPCDDPEILAQSMTFGVSLWRKKAYLAFLNMMYKKESRRLFHQALEEMASAEPGSAIEIYVVCSIAGATGSGTFIPITLYAKRYIRQHLNLVPTVSAVITCPDVFTDHLVPEGVDKAYANAYAAMRELNAINQVARNGCNRITRLKKTAVRFRLGSEREPVVGTLFDAADKRYWRPDAAPFDKVYVLDRIPGVHSIEAHNVVLADSLYTLTCTDVGAAVDAETSNHMTLTSQNNGGSAIFSSISTSRIKFPINTLLDYFSAERTLHICKDQWLTLHKATEKKIDEKRQQAIESQSTFVLTEEEYADILLDCYEELLEYDSGAGLGEMVDRWTLIPGEEGTRQNSAEVYFEELKRLIGKRGINAESAIERVKEYQQSEFVEEDEEDHVFFFLRGRKNLHPESVVHFSERVHNDIRKFYNECLTSVRSRTAGISDAVLIFDEHKNPRGHKELSLVERTMVREGLFMHPVAALIQLCRLRRRLKESLRAGEDTVHMESIGGDHTIPDAFFAQNEDGIGMRFKAHKSRYLRFAAELPAEGRNARLARFADKHMEYYEKRSEEQADFELIRQDAIATLENIADIAIAELRYQVFRRVATRIDMLIKHYRGFFDCFEEVEMDARADMEALKRRNVGRVGSIINVACTAKQKERFLEALNGNGEADRLDDVKRADNIAGEGVFDIAYQSACASQREQGLHRDDRNVVRRLLNKMNADNREVIKRNTEYKRLASMSVIQAFEESCGDRSEDFTVFRSKLRAAMQAAFKAAVEIATPTLRIDQKPVDTPGFINPSEIWRVLMSTGTARHVKKNADTYELPLQESTDERVVVNACAEEFVRKYIHPRARVSVVPDIPDDVMYITGELMDITPVRIAKINEMGKTPGYYPHYRRMLSQQQRMGSDIWNPHLGFDCYKRNVLPYINEEMDASYDARAVKALLYGFMRGLVRFLPYKPTKQKKRDVFVLVAEDGSFAPCEWDREEIKEHNVSYLFQWMRDNELLVDNWSSDFDELLDKELRQLPVAATEEDLERLNRAVSELSFVRMLRDGICVVTPPDEAKMERRMHLFDLADMIKHSEETRRDHNDAEKLLRVAFDVFCQICMTAAPPRIHLDIAMGVYIVQLSKIYTAYEDIVNQKYTKKIDGQSFVDPAAGDYFDRVFTWVSETDTFGKIDNQTPLNKDEEFCFIRMTHSKIWRAQLENKDESLSMRAAEFKEEKLERAVEEAKAQRKAQRKTKQQPDEPVSDESLPAGEEPVKKKGGKRAKKPDTEAPEEE